MVRSRGVEPPTFAFGKQHSIQLSYERKNFIKNEPKFMENRDTLGFKTGSSPLQPAQPLQLPECNA